MVNDYTYLGVNVAKDLSNDKESQTRLEKARQAFTLYKTNPALQNRYLGPISRITIARQIILSQSNYGLPAWLLSTTTRGQKPL